MGIVVATPHSKAFFGHFIESLLETRTSAPRKFIRRWGMAVDDARNELVKTFLSIPKATHLMFIDSDAVWHGDSVQRLYERDLPIVCGTMFTRQHPPMPTIADFDRESADGKWYYNKAETCISLRNQFKNETAAVKMPFEEFTFPPVLTQPRFMGDVEEKDGCGMHFTMIKREVFENMEPPWFKLRSETGAGEDFYFCQQAIKAGYKVYWDKTVLTGHSTGEQHFFSIHDFLKADVFIPEYKSVSLEV